MLRVERREYAVCLNRRSSLGRALGGAQPPGALTFACRAQPSHYHRRPEPGLQPSKPSQELRVRMANWELSRGLLQGDELLRLQPLAALMQAGLTISGHLWSTQWYAAAVLHELAVDRTTVGETVAH
jgi:hypothetical protein